MFGRRFDIERAGAARPAFFSGRLFGQHVPGACDWSRAHTLTDMPGADRFKFGVEGHPIEAEGRKRKLEPTPEFRAKQIRAERELLKRAVGNERELFREVLNKMEAKEIIEKIGDKVDQDYIHDFRNWVAGIGKRSDYVKAGVPLTSVGQAKLLSRHKSVVDFVDKLTGRVVDYYAEITNMRMRGPGVGRRGGPATLEDLWLYFKYVVRNDPIDPRDFAEPPGPVDDNLIGNQNGITDEPNEAPSQPPAVAPADAQTRANAAPRKHLDAIANRWSRKKADELPLDGGAPDGGGDGGGDDDDDIVGEDDGDIRADVIARLSKMSDAEKEAAFGRVNNPALTGLTHDEFARKYPKFSQTLLDEHAKTDGGGGDRGPAAPDSVQPNPDYKEPSDDDSEHAANVAETRRVVAAFDARQKQATLDEVNRTLEGKGLTLRMESFDEAVTTLPALTRQVAAESPGIRLISSQPLRPEKRTCVFPTTTATACLHSTAELPAPPPPPPVAAPTGGVRVLDDDDVAARNDAAIATLSDAERTRIFGAAAAAKGMTVEEFVRRYPGTVANLLGRTNWRDNAGQKRRQGLAGK